MSDGAIDIDTARSDTAFLATVPLFDGVSEAKLSELAQVLGRRQLEPGEVLWRQGDADSGMVLIVDGRVSLSLGLPGERTVQFASLGRGEVLGEIPLIDGGAHSATVRATEPTSLLVLSPPDFAALVSRRHPIALTVKRRIAALACGRLRARVAALAASLGPAAARDPEAATERVPAALEFCGSPDNAYMRRLATFRSFDSEALRGFLTDGRYARCPAGRTLVDEGAIPTACYLTINGAVEKVIVRGGSRIRAGLAGPGQAFGYESLVDGEPAPMSAITRERALLLVLPSEAFERLFHGEATGSHVFLDVINRDLISGLRQLLRPQARLASNV